MPVRGLSRYIAMDVRDPELETMTVIAMRAQRVGSVLISKSSFMANAIEVGGGAEGRGYRIELKGSVRVEGSAGIIGR
jgi:hypothetical protein